MFETLPGFREFYPEQFVTRRGLFDNWRRSLEICGFSEYEGSVLEPLELYIEKSGNEIVEQLFHFEDKGGRKVALRPEMTPTLARMVGSKANALRKPVKWFNIGDHFRYERMQKGRTRCFTQLNVDILGEAGVKADVEAICSLMVVFRRLGLNENHFFVRLSDRDLWLLGLTAMGINKEQQPEVLAVIDKIERTPEEKVLESLSKVVGSDQDAQKVYVKITSMFEVRSVQDIRNWFSQFGDLGVELDEQLNMRLAQWDELTHSLNSLGYGPFIKIDFSIVRGLAYYTGFVFEAFERSRKSRALAGGGRYDHLVKKLGGPDFPAVGWAMGDVTLMDCLNHFGLAPECKKRQRVFAVMEDSTRDVAMSDIGKLRQEGVAVIYSFKGAGFGKQFKEANQNSCNWVLVYGSAELESNAVILKNLQDGSETSIPRNSLITYLRERRLAEM